MPRTSSVPDKRGLELTQHKLKIRTLKGENAELKRSGKIKDLRIARLQMAVDYLTKCAKSEDEPKPTL